MRQTLSNDNSFVSGKEKMYSKKHQSISRGGSLGCNVSIGKTRGESSWPGKQTRLSETMFSTQ